MTTSLLITSTVLVTAFQCFAQSGGPVADYPFTRNARDASGFGNDGIATRARLTFDRFGEFRKAFSFAGNGSRIVVPNSGSLQIEGTNITIAAWVAPTQFTGPGERRTILRKMPLSGGEGGYLFAINKDGFPQFGFRPQSTDYIERTSATLALAPDGWTHTAVTYDGAMVRFYLNGEPTDAFPQTGAIGVGDAPLVIGQLFTTTNNTDAYFGDLDEVQIYNSTLSATEIRRLYNTQFNQAPIARIVVLPRATFPGQRDIIVLAPNGEFANVTLSARQSINPDGDQLRFSWAENDQVFSTSQVTTRSFPLGTHRVTLTVSDRFAQDTTNAVINVISLRDSVGILMDMINRANIPLTKKRNLIATLNSAAASFERNRLNSRPNQLGIFQQQVRGQLSSTNPVLAANLLKASQTIINASTAR
ncbi:MAG TPA: LamG-like jellyroll fold domain-containing protein [Clostridia bacterium]|nr:LamG-like jellyroll fold domain-containing protein [Clostridia bacterium]